MPVLNIPRDTRWGELGAGLGSVLSAFADQVGQQRIAQGVADISQDPSIPPEQKFATVLKRFGERGVQTFGQLEQARVLEQQLQAGAEAQQAGDIAWPALLGAAPAPPIGDLVQPPIPRPQTAPGAAPGAVGNLPEAAGVGPDTTYGGGRTDPMYGGRGAPGMTGGAGVDATYGGRGTPGTGPRPLVGGGVGARAGTARLPPWEQVSSQIAQAETGGRNILGDSGTSGGPLQIHDPTWQQFAPKVPGAAQYPRAIDAPPEVQDAVGKKVYEVQGPRAWTTVREGKVPALRQFADRGGMPSKQQVRVDDLVDDALSGVSALQYGAMQRRQLAQAIEAANPGAPAHLKMLAFERAAKVLAPDERMAWELAKVQMNADRRVALAQIQGQIRAEQAGDKPAIFQRPTEQGGGFVAVRPGMGPGQETVTDIPDTKGLTKVGGPGTASTLTDAQAEYWAQYVAKVGHLPMALGRNSADRQKILAKATELGLKPEQIAENMATFKADSTALARATSLAAAATSYEETALKNLDVATEELHKAAPTGFGPWLNRWALTGEMQLGGKKPPAAIAAVLTFANEYAKVMSGATGAQAATVSARQEAEALFSPYFNAGQWDAAAGIARRDMANRKQSLWDEVDFLRANIRDVGSGQPSMGPVVPPTQTPSPNTGGVSPEDIGKYFAAHPDAKNVRASEIKKWLAEQGAGQK